MGKRLLYFISPVGLIFVPSVNGNSYSTDEFSSWLDCDSGANVLLHTARQTGRTSQLCGFEPLPEMPNLHFKNTLPLESGRVFD